MSGGTASKVRRSSSRAGRARPLCRFQGAENSPPPSHELGSSGGQALPLVRRNDAFCVRVGVDGHTPQWMRFDTGYSGALEWVAGGAKARRFIGTAVATAAVSRGHIQTEVLLGTDRVSSVKTGVHAQPIFPGEAGRVGNELLSQFHMTVDDPGSRLLLRRVAR